MAGVLHGSARTTPRVRAELQASKETTRALAARYGLNRNDGGQVAQARTTTADAPMGPARPRQHGADAGRGSHRRRVPAADAAAARRCPGLPAGQHPQAHPQRPAPLPRSPRHLPAARDEETTHPSAGGSPRPTIGYVHIDICELRLADGKLNMFLAIDRVSKFTYVEFHDNAGKMNGAAFLRECRRGLPLQDPHRADRQRHGLRRSAQEPRRAQQALPRRRTSSIASATRTASSTGSPSPIILGPTARPSG